MRMHVRPTLYPVLIALSIVLTILFSGVTHPYFWGLAATFGLMGLVNLRKPNLVIHLSPVSDEDIDYEDDV